MIIQVPYYMISSRRKRAMIKIARYVIKLSERMHLPFYWPQDFAMRWTANQS